MGWGGAGRGGARRGGAGRGGVGRLVHEWMSADAAEPVARPSPAALPSKAASALGDVDRCEVKERSNKVVKVVK